MDSLADTGRVRDARAEIKRIIAAGTFAPRWDSLAASDVPA